jgi:FhuF 2Fe-2S C-terminal domain
VTARLDELTARLRALDPYLAADIGRGDALAADLWITPASLASDRARLERLADAYGERWGVRGDRTSQASFILLDYSWYGIAPPAAACLAYAELPALDGAAVWLDPQTREGRLALNPGAQVTEGATVHDLRTAIERHMAPLVDALVERRWIGRRPAWWGIGDRVVGALEHAALALGTPGAARPVAEALVHHPGSPLDAPRHRFIEIVHDGRTYPIGLRASCCRFYRVPDVDKCVTCPLVPEPERAVRLREWVGEIAAAASA